MREEECLRWEGFDDRIRPHRYAKRKMRFIAAAGAWSVHLSVGLIGECCKTVEPIELPLRM